MFNFSVKDEDLDLKSILNHAQKIRTGARGIILFNNKIAIFCKKKKNEFKLPGGGVNERETLEEAFMREVFEETGCEVKIIEKIGVVTEYRTHDSFVQISHVFLGKVVNDTGKLNLTDKEKGEGGEVLWCSPKEGLELINNAYENLIASVYESLYHTKFINRRDYLILKYYVKNYLQYEK